MSNTVSVKVALYERDGAEVEGEIEVRSHEDSDDLVELVWGRRRLAFDADDLMRAIVAVKDGQ